MKHGCPKKNLLGISENAWFPWQPIGDYRTGCAYKITYISAAPNPKLLKLNTKLKLRHRHCIRLSHMKIILFAYSQILMKQFNV